MLQAADICCLVIGEIKMELRSEMSCGGEKSIV